MSGKKQIRTAICLLAMECLSSVLQGGETGKEQDLKPNTTFNANQEQTGRPRAIKIATIGSLPPAVSADATPEQILQHVKRHWRSRFDQVLPDRPDLIVVPENCDHC